MNILFAFLQLDVNWYGVEVTGSTLGIIGMGSIGTAVAKRARAFDMRVLYHNRNRVSEAEEKLLGRCCHTFEVEGGRAQVK